jgi:NADPH:quinone reductase-like Zn-dependent oxidoreductase
MRQQMRQQIVIDSPGSYDKLKLKESLIPSPGPGEVLIECHAAGVNFADCLVRMGLYSSAKEFVGWPITPGFEAAGIVLETGRGVTELAKGQRVAALTLFGGYTTHLIVKEDQALPLPDSISFAEAAALPTVFLTAYYALFELVHPRPEQKLLIHSAAGGVGGALVQLAKSAGCLTAGVVGSPHKVEYVQKLGASLVIDKSSTRLWDEGKKFAPEGFDAVFDANGVETLRQSYRHLRVGGKLVVYGFHSMFSKNRGTPNWFKLIWDYCTTPRFNPLEMTQKNRSVMGFNLSYQFMNKALLRESLLKLLSQFQKRELSIPSITLFPLSQAGEAQKALESGKTIGKLVLTCK